MTGVPGTAPAPPAIRVRDVAVRYGEVTALDGVDLEIPAGRVTALIGMNGSGKSTLFAAMMGLTRLDRGEVRLGGVDPATARRRGLVGWVPQSETVDWSFPVSVRDVVMMGRAGLQGFTRRVRPVDRDAVAGALDRVELTELADRQIGRLSGGQRKRAFVARGIAQEAQILLLDEPFAGVDRPSEATIVRLLRGLAADGRTVLISTHDLQGVPELADDVILLRGRVLHHGPVAEALRPERLGPTFGIDLGGGAP